MVGFTGHADHRGAGAPGELRAEQADAAGHAADQHRVIRTGLYRRGCAQRRVADEPEPAGRFPIQGGGFRRNTGGARQHEVGLAARRPAQNLVAERDSRDAVAEFVDDSGEFAALTARRGEARHFPPAHLGIERIGAGGAERNADLAGARVRFVGVDDLEHLRAAVPRESDCA